MAKKGSDYIHVINAALDEIATKQGQQIVLRGVIEPASLPLLKVDDYQRDPLPLSALSKLWQALRDGESLPDIELGMRGNDYDCRGKKDEFWLENKVYIIDGQQRRNAAIHILSLLPELPVRLGAMIHFGTTREWERERFKILNLDRSRVSVNVILRNMRHQSAAILTLYGLTHNEPNFALFERVCWKQSASAHELISARTLTSVVAALHAHRSPAFRYSVSQLVPALDRQAGFVKLDQWRKNIVMFFDLLDECWGIRAIGMKDLALQTRIGFLLPVASLLSDHRIFWRGEKETELYIDVETRKRLATFSLHEPTIVQLISSGGAFRGNRSEGNLFYALLRDHLNKGRSSNRLRSRHDEESEYRSFPSDASLMSIDHEDEEEVEHP